MWHRGMVVDLRGTGMGGQVSKRIVFVQIGWRSPVGPRIQPISIVIGELVESSGVPWLARDGKGLQVPELVVVRIRLCEPVGGCAAAGEAGPTVHRLRSHPCR